MTSGSTYKYLESDKGSFPKKCMTCSRTYKDLTDFFESTTQVPGSTGLAEFQAAKSSNVVGVFRNCDCGSTMLVACRDRRDLSEAGEERRKNFDRVLDCLENMGLDREQARLELRRFMQGERSELLEQAGLRR
jgi:hypothetical protein